MKTTKRLIAVLLAGLAAGLAGCIVTSVYPFYSEKDVAFEPSLLGRWTKPGDPKEAWTFDKEGKRAYEVAYTDGSKTNVMLGHSFRLKGELFLDLFTPGKDIDLMPPPIPSHMLLRIFQQKPTLKMAALNYEWLDKFLQENPKALRHHLIVDEDKPDNHLVVLTADTPELQAFVTKHLKTEDAWKDPFELKHE